ncbi:MAG: glycosyltransferase family 4 protein [Saprospiraceae bacterium]|nr:glycosyltransferase family 4 protein [Saprospiraceae bacterium]
MQVHFLIPDPGAFQSGGNRYNAALIAALRQRQVHVSHSPFNPEIYYASPDTIYVLDSLYFESIAQPDALPPQCLALVHHLNSMYPGGPGYYERHEAPVLERMAGYIATSHFTREYLAERGLEEQQIVVIEPVVDRPTEIPDREVARVRGLIVANCIPRKGVLPFLQALADARPQPYFDLNVIGSLQHDETYARSCQALIRETPVLAQCVRLMGEQDDATLHGYYDKSNIFLSPSEFETFGMAIQEAIVYGLPALVHSGGNSEHHVRPGVNGEVFTSHQQMARTFAGMVDDLESLRQLHLSIQSFEDPYLDDWLVAADLLTEFVDRLSTQAS